MITERDYYNIINTAKNDGRAEGEAIGRAEGEAIGRAEGEAKGRAEGEAIGRAEGEAKGRAEGEAKGRAEGRIEGRIEIAKSLKQLGVPAETIMQATGMSEQELLDL